MRTSDTTRPNPRHLDYHFALMLRGFSGLPVWCTGIPVYGLGSLSWFVVYWRTGVPVFRYTGCMTNLPELPQYRCGLCGEEFGSNCHEDDISCTSCGAKRCPHCGKWFGED